MQTFSIDTDSSSGSSGGLVTRAGDGPDIPVAVNPDAGSVTLLRASSSGANRPHAPCTRELYDGPDLTEEDERQWDDAVRLIKEGMAAAARGEAEALREVAETTAWNDATQHGAIDDDILDAEVEISFSPYGESTPKGKWRTKAGTVRTVFDWLSKHEVGDKDGVCFMQGALVGFDRNAAAVKHQDFLVMDVDSGEPLANIHEKVRKMGVVALVATTHSHMKTTTEIKRDALIKWLEIDGEDDLTDQQVIDYLTNAKGYHPAVLDGATIIGEDHTAKGVMVFVKHNPMPKARVVFVLAQRFSFSKGGTQAERTKAWKEHYAGVAKTMGLVIDKACTDLPRLFFTPRHAKGAQFQIDIFPGEYLDLESFPRVTAAELREGGENPFADAASDLVGKGGSNYKTTNMMWFFGKYGDRFDLDTFLLEVDPDGDRGQRATGAGRTHRCPNDDMHTDAGNPDDKGFFCVNALDSETEQAVAKCMHASCADLDRLNFVDLACQAVGIKDATELKKWVPELVGDESDKPTQTSDKPTPAPSSGPSVEPFKSFEDARVAIEVVKVDDEDLAISIARRIGAMTDLSPSKSDGLLKKLSGASKMGLAGLKAERKLGQQERKKDDKAESPLDDDGMKTLAAWNKKYAVVTIGGKVRILQEPTKAGTMPPLFEVDSFKTLKANEKVPHINADGEVKQEAVSKLWLEWPGRQTYDGGIVFEPGGKREGEYNLWRGYPVKGRQGDWTLLRGHMFENICQANPEYFEWLMLWLAQLFQQPGNKLGTAVAVKGKKGTGKSKVFDWVRKAMGQHAIKVSHRSHITGNFNAHQTGVVLMVCEEAFWAGDNSAGGVLKDLITSDKMMMEKKGVDPVEVSNYARLVMISNEDWVVPAGLDDERRFFVLECGNGRIQDSDFFAAIDKQMDSGGLEAMVHELTNLKPPTKDWAILRHPPKTPWLIEQADQGTTPAERFFIRTAEDGEHEFRDAKGDDLTLTLRERDLLRGDQGENARQSG